MLKNSNAGYKLGVIATAVVLIWIGVFKFTAAEAAGIKNYVEHSFLMSWMYSVGSVQQVSDFVGIFEITTGVLLIASFWNRKAGMAAGYLTLVIFLTTLSFIFTTPGTWKIVEGVPITDFFVLKDLVSVAIGLQVLAKNSEEV